jgi:hypothetical protein
MTRDERQKIDEVGELLESAYDALDNDLPAHEDDVLVPRVDVLLAKCRVNKLQYKDDRKRRGW